MICRCKEQERTPSDCVFKEACLKKVEKGSACHLCLGRGGPRKIRSFASSSAKNGSVEKEAKKGGLQLRAQGLTVKAKMNIKRVAYCERDGL